MARSVQSKMQDAFEAAGGTNGGIIPWVAILDAIKALLGGCTTTRAAQRWAKRNPDACKDMIAEKIKDEGVSIRGNTNKTMAVQAAYDTFVGLSANELNSL